MKDVLGKALLRWRIRTVLPHVKGRLLDIGCGTNELAKAAGHDSVGADVFQWGTVDIVVPDTAVLPLEDASFDTVSIIAALNHIPNREQVLKEAHRLCKPGGRLLVTMIPPTISRVWHFVRAPWDADQHERGMVEGEVYGFTREAVRSLISSAGFRVKEEILFMARVNCLTVAEKI